MTLPLDDICDAAQSVGFDACATAPVHRIDDDASYMEAWLEAGHHGQMHYLERNREARYHPAVLVEGAQTVVVCLLTYAHSGHDYHRAVKSRLYEMQAILTQRYGQTIVSEKQHIFCDSAPLLERRWAVEAGLGWIGRNRQLIHPTLGSMVHPGEMLLNVPVDTHGAIHHPIANGCHECQRCVETCPSGALRQHEWHAPDCIAYTTHHCLQCQLICPYNETHS